MRGPRSSDRLQKRYVQQNMMCNDREKKAAKEKRERERFHARPVHIDEWCLQYSGPRRESHVGVLAYPSACACLCSCWNHVAQHLALLSLQRKALVLDGWRGCTRSRRHVRANKTETSCSNPDETARNNGSTESTESSHT